MSSNVYNIVLPIKKSNPIIPKKKTPMLKSSQTSVNLYNDMPPVIIKILTDSNCPSLIYSISSPNIIDATFIDNTLTISSKNIEGCVIISITAPETEIYYEKTIKIFIDSYKIKRPNLQSIFPTYKSDTQYPGQIIFEIYSESTGISEIPENIIYSDIPYEESFGGQKLMWDKDTPREGVFFTYKNKTLTLYTEVGGQFAWDLGMITGLPEQKQRLKLKNVIFKGIRPSEALPDKKNKYYNLVLYYKNYDIDFLDFSGVTWPKCTILGGSALGHLIDCYIKRMRWGLKNINVGAYYNFFYHCHLEVVDLNDFNFEQIQHATRMFRDCIIDTLIAPTTPIRTKALSLESMFYGTTIHEIIGDLIFEAPNLLNARQMFGQCVIDKMNLIELRISSGCDLLGAFDMKINSGEVRIISLDKKKIKSFDYIEHKYNQARLSSNLLGSGTCIIDAPGAEGYIDTLSEESAEIILKDAPRLDLSYNTSPLYKKVLSRTIGSVSSFNTKFTSFLAFPSIHGNNFSANITADISSMYNPDGFAYGNFLENEQIFFHIIYNQYLKDKEFLSYSFTDLYQQRRGNVILTKKEAKFLDV